jgi:hypothetical protein
LFRAIFVGKGALVKQTGESLVFATITVSSSFRIREKASTPGLHLEISRVWPSSEIGWEAGSLPFLSFAVEMPQKCAQEVLVSRGTMAISIAYLDTLKSGTISLILRRPYN